MSEVWALNQETDGVECDVSDPVARALCARPELRGLPPALLADELGVTRAAAQVGILKLASKTTGVRVVLRGVSFDEALSAGGRVMGRKPIAYARDAGALDAPGTVTGLSPLGWFALGAVLGAVGASLLSGSGDEESEDE